MSAKKPFILEVTTELALPHGLLDQAAKKFGAEKAIECAMATSVGGIGPLLRDRIQGQSEKDLEVLGISLLFETVWVQKKAEDGKIGLQKREVGEELRRLLTPTSFGFQLTLFNGEKVDVTVWKAQLESCVGYYLSCPAVTDVVYPGPVDAPSDHPDPGYWAHEHRLKQNWLLGRGALTLVKQLDKSPDFVVLSESSTIFAHNKFFLDGLQKDSLFAKTKYIYNDHTPMDYAHPQWDEKTVKMVRLDPRYYASKPAWDPVRKHLNVTSLAVSQCDGVYGVAKKHEATMKAMPALQAEAGKIRSVTNGVRKAEWQAPELKGYENLTDDELCSFKQAKREALIQWLFKHYAIPIEEMKNGTDRKIVLWTRRITAYKRLDIFNALLKDKTLQNQFLDLNLLLIVGGRIHQEDKEAQTMAHHLMEELAKNPSLKNRIVFIFNYNVWEAPLFYQGADASIMISDQSKEASATGFMKALMNGAVVIGTADGAVPEFVEFKKNGFEVPYVQDQPTPEGLIQTLKEFNTAFNNASQRAKMIRASIEKTPQLSTARTIEDLKKVYQGTTLGPPRLEVVK